MTDFEKIGAIAIECLQKNGRWVFLKDGSLFDLAPAGATEFALSPIVWGIDRLLGNGAKLLGIPNPEQGCLLVISQNFLPKSDVKLNYLEQQFDGWLYAVEELNLKGLLPGQKAWICPYMKYFFNEPPESIFVKIEGIKHEI